MIDLDELPLVSGLASTGGVIADILLNGGDFILGATVGLVTHLGPLMGLVGPLYRLAPRYDFLPPELLDSLYTGLLWVSVAVSAATLLRTKLKNDKK